MVQIVSQAGPHARHAGKAWLREALTDARERTLRLLAACERALGPSLAVPHSIELNPPLWEAGHIGWFADWWIARNPGRFLGTLLGTGQPRAAARQARDGWDADALYNSSTVAHDTRWHLRLPDVDATRDHLVASLQDTLAWLEDAPPDDQGLYFFRLALFHEDMHGEAALYMAQTLGIDPGGADRPAIPALPGPPRQLALAPQTWMLGHDGPGFVFDNERCAHPVTLDGGDIDAHAVTWGQYLPFIEDGAYDNPRLWSPEGWAWRQAEQISAPRHLRRAANAPGSWEAFRFGRWEALGEAVAACHLSAHEAQAWCRWAGRRLPTEAEWEAAACTLPGFTWGQVWEWTSSAFTPYPGFEPHPYADYSAPWFDGRPVLRGASAATAARMRHPRYRNYFVATRNDIYAGFRSMAA
ncbi:selenoneine synthase SenA [Hydrogenophaga aquatica]